MRVVVSAGFDPLKPSGGDEIHEEQLMPQTIKSNGIDPGVNTRRANWSLAEDQCFLGLLKEIMIANNSDHDITRGQWELLMNRYNERTPGDKVDKTQLKCRLQTLKRLYNLHRALRSEKGWTWDSTRHMVIAPDDKAWEEMIEQNSQFRKVKRKGFPLYDTIDQMFGKNIPHDLKEEGDGSSASSKEEADGVEKDNSIHYVTPLAQMPPPPQTFHTPEPSPVAASNLPTNTMKRPRSESVSVKVARRRDQAEETSRVVDHRTDGESWKDDLREVHKKIKSVHGTTVAQRISAMEACRDPITREMVKIFDLEEVQYWLMKFHTETRESGRYSESFDMHDRVAASPASPVTYPPTYNEQ